MSADGQAWLDRYRAAWVSSDRATIESLFTDDAEYRFRPYLRPVIGAGAIADAWLEEPDDPGSWTADYRVLATDGDVVIATGETSYPAEGKTYSNLFVIELAGDRCRSFTEWFMLHRDG